MWAIKKLMRTTPVIAITTFFPIMVCQKAVTRCLTTTLLVVASARSWTAGLKFFMFCMSNSVPLGVS
jgi:hypothetical protein